jgi:serine phosphatase RsbU (regulator of sigma subunit)
MQSGEAVARSTDEILKIPLFSGLPEEEGDSLIRLAKTHRYEQGAVLFREGDPSNSFIIILDGEVEVIKGLESDTELYLGKLGQGDYLGEMSLFLRKKDRSASVRAAVVSNVAEIPSKDFEALLMRQPALAFHLMQEMSLRVRNQDRLTTIDLRQKNQQLEQAYNELKEAQAQLIAQEKLKHELAVARIIQESMLPKSVPQLAGWRISARWQPAREVSGDFYDFIPLTKDRLAIVVGDVTDKGVPASLVMAVTRSVLRAVANSSLAIDGGESPGHMLSQMNDVLTPDMPRGMFVTCLISILDVSKNLLRYATAGHPPPILRSGNSIRELRAKGMPLGILDDQDYPDQEITIDLGDRLLFFSDGIVEAHNEKHQMFGEMELLEQIRLYSGPDILDHLFDSLAAFSDNPTEPEDDITLVSLDRLV